MSYSCDFTHAICRLPSVDLTTGLRAVDVGDPDSDIFTGHHADYVATLREAGADVTVLDALPDFPDAVFVEDTALCLPKGAILMRPGAPSRQGEVAHMAPALKVLYGDAVTEIVAPGRIEAGDILITEREVLVGMSERTDRIGVRMLGAELDRLGYALRVVDTPEGVLHFKTDCSLLEPETVLSTKRLAASGCFDDYKVLLVPEGEEAAANAIRVNGFVIMADGFPKTAEMLNREGFHVRQIGNSEAAKLDGGMSCLSLRIARA